MPAFTKSVTSSEPDTYSLLSQATTTMTIGDSLPAALVRKSARKGFTFNIMLVGPANMGQATLISALFGKKIELEPSIQRDKSADFKDPLNPPVIVDAKTYDIDDKKVKLKLTVVDSKNYGLALKKKNSHLPLVKYIDEQFAHYYKRETCHDRRQIQDQMIHCLFFFISAVDHGLSTLDLDFLKAVHEKVNIVPIIARAEALTIEERASFKRRVLEALDKNKIRLYQMPDPDLEDTEDIKRSIKEIRNTIPFAIPAMTIQSDCTPTEHDLGWAKIDPFNRDHSDFLVLKTMIYMQMTSLHDSTHEVLYENYRVSLREGRVR